MKQFEILKKRYSRKRNALRKSSASGAGSSDVSGPTRELEKYAFLAWLNPFIQLRRTKSNFDDSSQLNSPDNLSAEDELEDEHYESENEFETELKRRKVQYNTQSKKQPEKPIKKTPPNNQTRAEIQNAELEIMRGMTDAINKIQQPSPVLPPPEEESLDNLFGKVIAGELKRFPEDVKFQVKHEINNVIYKFRSQVPTAGRAPPTTPLLSSPQASIFPTGGWVNFTNS